MAARETSAGGELYLQSPRGSTLFRKNYSFNPTEGADLQITLNDIDFVASEIDVAVPPDVESVYVSYSDVNGSGSSFRQAQNGRIVLPRFLSGRSGTLLVSYMDGGVELRDLKTGDQLQVRTLPAVTLKASFANNVEVAPSENPIVRAEYTDFNVRNAGYTAKATFTVSTPPFVLGTVRLGAITETKFAIAVQIRLLPNGRFGDPSLPNLTATGPGEWIGVFPGGTYDAVFTFRTDPWQGGERGGDAGGGDGAP